MTCEECRQLLESHALDALTGRNLRRVQHHLSSCPDCAAVLADYEAILGDMTEALVEPTPPRAPSDTWNRIESRLGSSRRWLPEQTATRWQLALTSLLLLTLGLSVI